MPRCCPAVLFILAMSFFSLSKTATVKYKWGIEYKCLWFNDECVSSCPDWLVEVKSNCSQSYWNAQRTCEHPEARLVGTVCGFSRCDCPANMVMDTDTGFCYEDDNCPLNHSINYELIL